MTLLLSMVYSTVPFSVLLAAVHSVPSVTNASFRVVPLFWVSVVALKVSAATVLVPLPERIRLAYWLAATF